MVVVKCRGRGNSTFLGLDLNLLVRQCLWAVNFVRVSQAFPPQLVEQGKETELELSIALLPHERLQGLELGIPLPQVNQALIISQQ